MQLICFECKKKIDHRGRYFEVKVFEWSKNIGHQVHGTFGTRNTSRCPAG